MRLIDADKIEYYPIDRDGKHIGEMVWKPHIDGIETFNLEAHDREVIAKFAAWIGEKYEVFEPEDDGFTLYGDMRYHSVEELLNEYNTLIDLK